MSRASDNIEANSPKRMKKEPGGVKGKSVVVLRSSDVTRRDFGVFMPNTIEMAQLKKQGKGQFKTNVEISSQMTEMDIQRKLVEIFPILKHKRFYCAAAVDNRTRLDFHGEPRIWDGHFIKRKITGNSALYILLAEEEQQQHNDHIVRGLPEQLTLKRSHDQITTNKQPDFPVSNMVPAGSGKQAMFVAVPGNPPKNVTGYPIVVSGVAQRVEKSGINLQQDKLPPMQGFVLCHPNMATSSLPQSLPMGTIMVPAGGGVVAKPGSIADKAISTISDQQSLKKAVFHRVKGPDARQPGLQLTAAPQVMVSSVLTPQMSNLNISGATSQQSQKLVIEEKSIGKRDQNVQTAETTEKSQQAPTITTMGQSKSYKVTSNKTATGLQKVVRFISADQSRQSLHEKMNSSQDESLSDVHVQRTDDSENEIFSNSKQKVVIHMDLELPEKIFSSDDDDEDDLPADNIVAPMQDICPSSGSVKVDKKPQVPVTTSSSDGGFDEAVDISDDNIGAVVQDIFPRSGYIYKVGESFSISLTAELSEDNETDITYTANFVKADAPLVKVKSNTLCATLEKLNPYTLCGIIPWNHLPGKFRVTVSTQAGQLPGMTYFTYVDGTLELLKQLVKDGPARQSQFFAMWSQELRSISGSDTSIAENNGSLIQTKQAQSVKVLHELVLAAAQTDAQQFIQMIFSTSARANGHDNLAQHLQDVNIRLSKESSSGVQSDTIDWLELVKAVDEIQKQTSVTENETDCKSGQSDDDDNQRDYFADDETSSCGSSDLEFGEGEDGEGTCTKDGGLKKEPSERRTSSLEGASIEVPPETGTQLAENLEMTKGDESYKEPSIIDSKDVLSLDRLFKDLVLSVRDDTTARQQGIGEPIEGEDASIEVPPEMGTQLAENLEMTKGDESYEEASIITTARQQGVGVEETQEIGSVTQRIRGRTQKSDDSNAEQQDANACPSQERTAKPKIKQLQMPQPDDTFKPGGKRVESKSGQPSTLRSSLQKDQSVTEQRTADISPLQKDQSITAQRTADSLFSPLHSDEQRTGDSSSSNIRTARANTESSNSKQGAKPKEVTPSSTERTTTLEGNPESSHGSQVLCNILVFKRGIIARDELIHVLYIIPVEDFHKAFRKIKQFEDVVCHASQIPIGEETQTMLKSSLYRNILITDMINVHFEMVHGGNFSIVCPSTITAHVSHICSKSKGRARFGFSATVLTRCTGGKDKLFEDRIRMTLHSGDTTSSLIIPIASYESGTNPWLYDTQAVSESDVEPKVAAPSWNRSQAANEKTKKKVEEEQSLASSNYKRHQPVSNESLDHLAGDLKGTVAFAEMTSNVDPPETDGPPLITIKDLSNKSEPWNVGQRLIDLDIDGEELQIFKLSSFPKKLLKVLSLKTWQSLHW